MSEQITIQVSDRVARRAATVASAKKRRIEDVLSDWLERAANEMPVQELPNEEILALADLEMTKEQESRLSELLTQNRERTLDEQGRRQLDELMRFYEHGLLRKAQALRVAVERGLREPLCQ